MGRSVDSGNEVIKTEGMLSTSLREHLLARPFEPFVIQMNDGRRFEVPHPEFAAINRQGTQFMVFRDNGAAVILSALLIASIEPLRPAAHSAAFTALRGLRCAAVDPAPAVPRASRFRRSAP